MTYFCILYLQFGYPADEVELRVGNSGNKILLIPKF